MATKTGGRGSSRGSGSAKKKATKKKTTAKKATASKRTAASKAKKTGAAASAATEQGTDWEAVRLAYVNSSMSLTEVAEKMGASSAAVRKRAEREGWAEQRRELSQEVAEKAQAAITEKRAKELEEFNETDLRVARALRAQVARVIQASQRKGDGKKGEDETDAAPILLSAQDLRALAGTAEVAQRMGRLALGANTDNHVHTGKDGETLPAQPVAFYLPDNGRGDNEGA